MWSTPSMPRHRRPLGRSIGVLALAAAAAACTTPPPEAFVTTSAAVSQAESAGQNARNEECLVQPGRAPATDLPVLRAREVFCGGWTQPAARLVELRGAPRADASQLDALAAGGVWRRWLDQRVSCGAPQSTTLSDGRPARLLACTRRNGGWPHMALLTTGTEGPVLADGVGATLPVLERLITGQGVQAGSAAPPRSAALTLALSRLSADSFGASEVGRYEQLMTVGRELNQAENFAAAEDAYRSALAVQERVLGRDNPNLATALARLALNLSNQGRHGQVGPLLARAEALAPRAADPTAAARVLHYRGLHVLNLGEPARAMALLERAERAYAALVPPGATAETGDSMPGGLLLDPMVVTAQLGLAEARRMRGVAAARIDRAEEAARLQAGSREYLRQAGLEPELLVGRSLRSQAISGGGPGGEAESARLLSASAQRFSRVMPGERPEAVTLFLAGSRRLSAGSRAEALAEFRAGARILRTRQLALPVPLVMPYLDALHEEARRNPANAAALHAEMFEAAQLAQRAETTRLVAQAAARLGTSGGNPRVAEAVRRLQEADRGLRALFAERDAADGEREIGAIDARIADLQAERMEAESDAAAAAPGYRQLLGISVDASAAARVLGPRDALLTMLFGTEHGYSFVLRRDGAVAAERVTISEAELARRVNLLRASISSANEGSGNITGRAQPAAMAAQAGLGRFSTELAHDLHQLLIAPLAGALAEVDTLLVAPDGPMLSIPFGLLLTAPADPDRLRDAAWLIRRYAVVHVPSPQSLVTLRTGAGRSAAPLPYVGFGDPVPPALPQLARSFPSDRCAEDARLAAQLSALPGTRAEVNVARQMMGAGADATRLGTAFTTRSLQEAELGRYRVIHLATHALLPGELSCLQEPAIMASVARTAPDAAGAFLTASEVLDLRLDADLVILSACNTGTVIGGQGAGGEALSGLARSFFYAGARSLMVTHWAVGDAAAALTVAEALRRHAQRGEETAQALRGAQLLFLEEAGRQLPDNFSHPYYWAGFAMIGGGKAPEPRLTAELVSR